jgi:hypothetical protein
MKRGVALLLCVAVCTLCAAQEKKPKEVDAATTKVLEVLKTKKVSFDFVETPLGDALGFMQGVLDVNMVVAPNVQRDLTVTLRVNEMAGGTALQWLLKLVDAQMEVRDGAVFVVAMKGGEKLNPKAGKLKKPGAPAVKGKQGRPLGKARVMVGDGAEIEFVVYEDDLGPELRGKLLELLRLSIEKELKKLKAEPKEEKGAL